MAHDMDIDMDLDIGVSAEDFAIPEVDDIQIDVKSTFPPQAFNPLTNLCLVQPPGRNSNSPCTRLPDRSCVPRACAEQSPHPRTR